MYNAIRGSMFVAAALGVLSVQVSGQAPAAAGRGPAPAAYRAPRAADGHADLNGIWQTMNTANWNLQDHPAYAGPMWELGAIGAVPAGEGVVQGNEIPYLPDKLAQKRRTSKTGARTIPKPNAIWAEFHAATTCLTRFRSCSPPRAFYSFTSMRAQTVS